MVIHGDEIKIYSSSYSTLIAGAKSCTIHKQQEAIETSNPGSQADKTYITGRSSWNISISHLVTSSTGAIPLVGTSYYVRVLVGTSTVLSGYAICTEADLVATVGSLAQGSLKLLGTGPLS